MTSASYRNRQRSPLFSWLLFLSGVGLAVAGIFFGNMVASVACVAAGAFTLLLALCFTWLEISEESEELLVRFGPVSLFQKRLSYESIRGVKLDKSLFIEGWGIHFGPRGWIWNIWGRDVIDLELDGGRLRLGTDDPGGLLAHLRERCVLPDGD